MMTNHVSHPKNLSFMDVNLRQRRSVEEMDLALRSSEFRIRINAKNEERKTVAECFQMS